MSNSPDNWVILKINSEVPFYKLLAGWSGGYTTGDSWRMNSGIVSVAEDEEYYYFKGNSGSSYACHKEANIVRMNIAGVLHQLKELYGKLVEVMPEGIDWIKEINND